MLTTKFKSPLFVELSITSVCNHMCIHCYNPNRKEGKTFVLKKEQVKVLAQEFKKNDIWSVTLTGGEPLTNLDTLYECIKEFTKLKMQVGLNTNLTGINDEIVERLKEAKFDSLILTSLPAVVEKTCDQITQISGSFKRIVEGIGICKKGGFRVGINTVISQANIDELDKIYDFVKDNELDFVSISYVIPPSYARHDKTFYLSEKDLVKIADTLLRIKNELSLDIGSVTPLPLCILQDIDRYMPVIETSCTAGIKRCSIEPSGDIKACSHETEVFGNIFTDGLKKSWKRMDGWRNKSRLNTECIDCEHLTICGGECRIFNELTTQYRLNKKANFKYTQVDFEGIELPLNTAFALNENLKIRKESFGAVIRVNGNDFFVSKKIFVLYKYILETKAKKIRDLSETFEINMEFWYVFNQLIKIGIIRILK